MASATVHKKIIESFGKTICYRLEALSKIMFYGFIYDAYRRHMEEETLRRTIYVLE